MKSLITKRPIIQLFFGSIIYLLIFYFHIHILWIIGIASLLGILLGKFFCKWMCPMGFIMELMTKNLSDEQKQSQMYNYYKLGCPISWIQGLTNKISLFKITNNKATCISCGKCDKACYIAQIDKNASLYKEDKTNPATAFNCSKCLACVETCPKGSLTYKTVKPR